MALRISLFLLMLGSVMPAVLAENPVPQGPDFIVNTYTTGRQTVPSVAMSSDGTSVVVWRDDDSGLDPPELYAQRFDSTGEPAGAVFQVNTYTTGIQTGGSVAMDDDGRFIIVWQSRQDGDGIGAFGQRFAADGTPDGPEFQINQDTAYNQTVPRVAMHGDGKFVVVWQSESTGPAKPNVFARRYDLDGAPLGGEFQVNTTPDFDMYPDVAMDSAGNFVVSWVSYPFSTPASMAARRYDADGSAVSGEFLVGTYLDTWKIRPRITASETGEFAILWEGEDPVIGGQAAFGQIFDAAGAATSGVFQANETPIASNPDAVFDASGQLMVSWGGPDKALARVLDPAGNAERCEFALDTSPGTHHSGSLAADGSGEILATWVGIQEGVSLSDIHARRFRSPCEPGPGMVSGLQLESTSGGTELHLIWEDLTGAVDFEVFEDSLPNSSFETSAGTVAGCGSPGCAPGFALPMPAGDRYYLVSGRNDCGVGPKRNPPASFAVIDTAADDLGLEDLETFFTSIDPAPTDYIHVALDGCTFPGFEWCAERADFYRDGYLTMAPGGGSATSGSWNKWYRDEGAAWSTPVTGGFQNVFGGDCGAYGWCSEIGLGGASHSIGVAPAEAGSCEIYDNTECADYSELHLTIGPSRWAVCGF